MKPRHSEKFDLQVRPRADERNNVIVVGPPTDEDAERDDSTADNDEQLSKAAVPQDKPTIAPARAALENRRKVATVVAHHASKFEAATYSTHMVTVGPRGHKPRASTSTAANPFGADCPPWPQPVHGDVLHAAWWCMLHIDVVATVQQRSAAER